MLRRVGLDPRRKQVIRVLGSSMAYVEYGAGDPVVLLHGNPTSSFLWRKVIPALSRLGRCIAPDLIGMGDSGRVGEGPNSYRFADHRRYVEAFMAIMGLEQSVTLVGHDWGGALAFDWARSHPGSVKAIAYMETIVAPLAWDDWPEPARGIFQAMRSDAGEEICLEKNVFVERILPASVLDPLPEEVMEEYRRPFREPGEARRPTLSWPREIPFDGQPPDVAAAVEAYGRFMAESAIPKLFVNAEPGSILVGRQRELCQGWPNQTMVTVRGAHFVQEDSGEEIGEAIAGWLETV